MDYKLAKELKDAGFPQDMEYGQHYYYFWGRMKEPKVYVVDGEYYPYPDGWWVKIPTLEEIISACNSIILSENVDMFNLRWGISMEDGHEFEGWIASGAMDSALGEYPEDAVSRLWLKIKII